MQLDALNRRLLDLLRENARESTAELARQLGLSRTAVHERLARLVAGGVIRRFTVELNDEAAGETVWAEVMIGVNPKKQASVVAGLERLTEVRSLYSVSGEYDLVARVGASSVAQVDAVLDRIGALDGIDRTQTAIILSCKFER